MKISKTLTSLFILGVVCMGASLAWARIDNHIMVTPGDLK